NDQLYHYYLGDPLEVLLLHGDGTTKRVVVGPNLRREQLQLFIPGNTFHTARLMGRRRWFLGASTEWPGVVPADVETGNVDGVAANFPSVAAAGGAIAASPRASTGGGRGAPFWVVCPPTPARGRGRGVRRERPPQPSLKAGPVDQLTTPITASAPPTSR